MRRGVRTPVNGFDAGRVSRKGRTAGFYLAAAFPWETTRSERFKCAITSATS